MLRWGYASMVLATLPIALLDACSRTDAANDAPMNNGGPIDTGLYVDAANAVQPYKRDGSDDIVEPEPGECRGPDGVIRSGCDYGLICAMRSALDAGRFDGGHDADAAIDAEVDANDADAGDTTDAGEPPYEMPTCIGFGGPGKYPSCGTFGCGPGCVCESPEKRICACHTTP